MHHAARVPVLMYHRVGEGSGALETRLTVPTTLFRAQMMRLRDHGFQAVSADAFVEWQQGRRQLPARSVLITFDDGFHDVFLHAVPVLRELGWPACMFLVAGLTGGRNEWDIAEHADAMPHRLLSAEQIQEMKSLGWSFHAHSSTHRRLTALDANDLRDETAGAIRELAAIGVQARYFCYPYGATDPRAADAVRGAGYHAAFTTVPAFARPLDDPFAIGRIEVFGSDTPGLLLSKIAHGAHTTSLWSTAGFHIWQSLGRLLIARLCSHALWRMASRRQAA